MYRENLSTHDATAVERAKHRQQMPRRALESNIVQRDIYHAYVIYNVCIHS